MLAISFLAAVICFLIVGIAADRFFGPILRENHIGTFYSEIRGEAISNQKHIRKKTRKYKRIKMDAKTYILYALPASAGIFVFCLIFLRSLPLAGLISLGGLFYPQIVVKEKIKKRKVLLNIQLRDMLQSISNSLKAGSSLQSAIERSSEDLRRVLKGQVEKPMLEEVELIIYEFQLGKTLEEALMSFRSRVDLEDVDTFVNAALITKEKGGNLTEVMANVSEAISDKIQIKREIMTLTAGKRAEARLLTFMPLVLVLLLSFVSPSYMRPMYETTMGKLMMVTGLLLLLINYVIGKKIININV